MKTSGKPWLAYKPLPYLVRKMRTCAAFDYLAPNEELAKMLLANPIMRILSQYPSAGMSLFALAAIVRKEPREVWEQVKREGWNECGYCCTTKLFVVDGWKPWGDEGRVEQLEPDYYERAEADYDCSAQDDGVPSFEDMFKLYPLNKCRLGFNPHGTRVFHFLPGDLPFYRKVYTLGVKKEKLSASLL